MAVNKKACRTYAEPGLTFNKGCGLFGVEDIKYILRTAVKNIAGRRTLLVYLYDREKAAAGVFTPDYTLFQTKDDYISLENTDDGKTKWRQSRFCSLIHDGYYTWNKYAFYLQKDKERMTRFCGMADKGGADALMDLQDAILRKRTEARIKKREQRTLERMKPLLSLPRDLKGWVHREVLPAYLYYQYHRKKSPMSGYCTACQRDVLVTGAKHNQKGVCPGCKREVTFKASGRTDRIWDRSTVQVLQKTKEGALVLRIIKVSRTCWNHKKPDLSVWENARIFIESYDQPKFEVSPYYYDYSRGLLTHWKPGVRPAFVYSLNFEGDLCGHLYYRNLDETLAETPWKYCQIGRFYRSEREPLEVIPYLRSYLQYPMIEYLVKLGLSNLTSHVVYRSSHSESINPDGRNIREVLGVSSGDLPVLQRLNVTRHQLELIQELKKMQMPLHEGLLHWYKTNDISSMEDILTPLKYMTPEKLMKYAERQFAALYTPQHLFKYARYERVSRILSEYRDYLDFGDKLGYDFNDSFVLLPKNLKTAHDQASKLFDVRKKEIYNQQIASAYQTLVEQYRFNRYGLTLVPPKTAAEIVKEGHSLHHCVHNYVSRVAEKECVILFLRKIGNIKKPFYTVELKDDRVIQVRGQGNCSPTPEVKKYITAWERKLLSAVSVKTAA